MSLCDLRSDLVCGAEADLKEHKESLKNFLNPKGGTQWN